MSGPQAVHKDVVMREELSDPVRVLDVASGIVARGGFERLTLKSLGIAAGVSQRSLIRQFGTIQEALVLMLNREFTGIYVSVVEHIDRDPRGGLLSRIYYYTLSATYERPLARMLYTVDRDAMNSIMRSANSFGYLPGVGIRADFIESMQVAGMARRDIDASTISRMLTIYSAGLALTAPHDDLDRAVSGVTEILARVVDVEVADTTPGKAAFYDWVMSLSGAR
jgi:AcrR family transcriptional regulator